MVMSKFKLNRQKLCFLVSSIVFCLVLSAVCFAEDGSLSSVNIEDIVHTMVTTVVGQIMTIIGVVATAVTGAFTIKIGVTKAFTFVKQVLNKV